MTFNVVSSGIKSLHLGDPHFRITNGMVISNRASMVISKSCPSEYRSILMQAINAGWIKPVAHVTEEEYMVMQLSN